MVGLLLELSQCSTFFCSRHYAKLFLKSVVLYFINTKIKPNPTYYQLKLKTYKMQMQMQMCYPQWHFYHHGLSFGEICRYLYKKNPMRTPCWKMIRNVLLLNIIKTCRFHRACWHTALTWPLLISRLSRGLSHPLSPHEVGRRGWGSLFPSCSRSVRQIEDSTPNTDEPIVVRHKKCVI